MATDPQETAPENTPLEDSGPKVQLDLEDAPFLAEEQKEVEQAFVEYVDEGKEPIAKKGSEVLSPIKSLLRRKKIVAIGVGAAFFMLVGMGIFLFLSSSTEQNNIPPPAQQQESPSGEKPQETVTAPPEPVEAPIFNIQWEPFWVEWMDSEGGAVFLTFSFITPTNNPNVAGEILSKNLVLRDALFYYLKNQSVKSLRDKLAVETLKSDMVAVINEHLGMGKISEVLIQDFVIK